MIDAIFFAVFDIEKGNKILHQVPPHSIACSTTPTNANSPTLFNFKDISSYILPEETLSNRPLQLLTPSHPHHRILSHPITIPSPTYPRNAFRFNFVLILSASTGFHTYIPIASKLARLFQHLEEHERFLSTEIHLHPDPNTGRIYSIIEQVLEDLNNYSECMIPIDGTTTTINLKLFPIYRPPPPLQAHQVPLLTVDVNSMRDDSSWDLTLLRILPYIDGVRSVKRIAMEADADFKLVRKAIRHLLYYRCATLLDIFHFGAIYAPTESIHEFIEDEALQLECLNYVRIPPLPGLANQPDSRGDDEELTCATLAELYCSLHQGQSVRTWILEHDPLLPKKIDIRRFITFGVIKRFLYRVHKYAIANSAVAKGRKDKDLRMEEQQRRLGKGKDEVRSGQPELASFLDGTHCFDEICTELMISEKELMGRLKAWDGDVQIVCR